jgi:hypothetical protein
MSTDIATRANQKKEKINILANKKKEKNILAETTEATTLVVSYRLANYF